ncbi:MAG: hypothetical protein QM811_13555 [Pirellulales bacterium]
MMSLFEYFLEGNSMARFARTLSGAFSDLFCMSDSWRKILLIGEHLEGVVPWAIDVQFRERDTVTFYHGTTKLLDLRFDPISRTVACSADPAYHLVPGYDQLTGLAESGDGSSLLGRMTSYLQAAIPFTNARYFANGYEGAWQNLLCYRYGLGWQPGDDWLIVDREAVLGHASKVEKASAEANIAAKYQAVRHTLQTDNAKLFGQLTTDGLGNEVDLLAIGPAGELAVIELKHGSNASGIYWAPLQAAVYRDSWQLALNDISREVCNLAWQKIVHGLLPVAAKSKLPAEGFKELRSYVWVAEPNERSSCWQRTAEVIHRCPEAAVDFYDVTAIENPALQRRDLPILAQTGRA